MLLLRTLQPLQVFRPQGLQPCSCFTSAAATASLAASYHPCGVDTRAMAATEAQQQAQLASSV